MLRQYFDIKEKHPNELLFFRLGDFYEMFADDAIEASKLLGITLTARHKGTPNEIPMCGVPHHSADQYIHKLTRVGKRVAICEQVSDPALPGIVKREVVKIITPGTTLSGEVLEQKKNNFMLGLWCEKGVYGVSVLDVSTGEFRVTEVKEPKTLREIVFLVAPSEIIIPEYNAHYAVINLDAHALFQLPYFEQPTEFLMRHFQVETLAGFGVEKYPVGIKAAAMLLGYVKETQHSYLTHINRLSAYRFKDALVLDESTIVNLELFQTCKSGEYSGSLLSVIDKTTTASGGRRLRKSLLHPLSSKAEIDERLEAVGDFLKHEEEMNGLRQELKHMNDMERILGKIGCQSANARDLMALKESLLRIPPIRHTLGQAESKQLKRIREEMKPLNELVSLLEARIVENPPASIGEGGMIKEGISGELDELREISGGGKNWIRNFQRDEQESTGIKSLKVKYNKIFGYYIEISNANKSQAPNRYECKQTLVNAQRYTTPELKIYEQKVLQAEEKIQMLEVELLKETLQMVNRYTAEVQKNASLLAELDVLQSFAQLAKENRYCRPEITEEKELEIKAGRHPVVEEVLKKENKEYIPNDSSLSSKKEIIILTGPNMAGKSSYLRQTALIVLLAHMGSFVPAASARIGIVDRIFTRVGASDDLAKGQSTFMVEMVEAANIINNATERSLIICDELGRGTSTYDGVSIAWAILEYIAADVKSLTLFATHYTELIDVAKSIPTAANYSIAVAERDGELIFLRKVVDGGVNKSYGIEVAQLAGIPKQIITRAKHILSQLENVRKEEEEELLGKQTTFIRDEDQSHEALRLLRETEIELTTPVEALVLLSKLKKKCQS